MKVNIYGHIPKNHRCPPRLNEKGFKMESSIFFAHKLHGCVHNLIEAKKKLDSAKFNKQSILV
ncbi:hypothetical protein BpHYR1_023458 [Brachionus plicatilis]|uniref:Uncharacterized protein n=1 Tax=Brachionus plicatilis TaxID=10195 RepID=A0A3M7RD59_BRAPC|nr:hypothetical protein BpHYR1_023458 [Brachionus plicatilis]